MLVATTAPAPQQASDFTDEQVLAVWETLDEATRVEVIEWFHVELERLNTFQMTLLRFVLTEDVQDPNDWPEYQEPAPYDPETHAPAQPIKRKTLAPGSAKLKQKRKARGRQLAMGRQLRDVATADVVVTNPTHFAVALRYRREENPSPIVVARGADLIALRIRVEAVRHDVPVIENRALARSLVSKGKVGFAIPQEFYGPVAKVLAAVYRRRRRP